MNNDPIKKLKNELSSMTEAQKRVADYIIRNQFDVAFSTVDQVANAVGTSTTTVMRLMTHLKYRGYSEFQRYLQENLRNKVTPETRLEANLRDLSKDNLWQQCYNKQIQNLEETMNATSTDQLDALTEKIQKARNVYIAAARGGAMVALYMHLYLARMYGNTVLVQSDELANWSTLIPKMNSQDLVIAITFPRYAKSLMTFVSAAGKQNVYVAGITDSYSSPLAEKADMVLTCDSSSLGFHNSPISAMMVADCIIGVLSLRDSARIKERLAASANVLQDAGYYY